MVDISKYPKTNLFYVKDTIGIPHPFCITSALIVFTANNYSGMLGKAAIEAFEKKKGKSVCGVKGCNMLYHEHETGLLIAVKSNKELKEIEPELREYLLSIKDMTEEDNMAGFAFIQEEHYA